MEKIMFKIFLSFSFVYIIKNNINQSNINYISTYLKLYIYK